MKTAETRITNRNIRGAQSMVLWGLTGVIFPILGIILGALAIRKTRIIEEDYDLNEYQFDKLADIRSQAIIIITLSVISIPLWWYISTYVL